MNRKEKKEEAMRENNGITASQLKDVIIADSMSKTYDICRKH